MPVVRGVKIYISVPEYYFLFYTLHIYEIKKKPELLPCCTYFWLKHLSSRKASNIMVNTHLTFCVPVSELFSSYRNLILNVNAISKADLSTDDNVILFFVCICFVI